MDSTPSYQRAVTPTQGGMDTLSTTGLVRGKMLSYQGGQLGSARRVASLGGAKADLGQQQLQSAGLAGGVGGGGSTASAPSSSSSASGAAASAAANPAAGGVRGNASTAAQQMKQASYRQAGGGVVTPGGYHPEMNVQGRSTSVGVGGSSSMIVGGFRGGGGSGNGSVGGVLGGLPAVPGSTSKTGGASVDSQQLEHTSAQSLASLPRYDLYPLSDEIPTDGIIFAKVRNQADSLVVFRTPEERLRNPERLNLDRRQLDVCPLLEQEQRLRLLNFQNNSIRIIQNLENLPNLIFLDLYNNKLASLEGPISSVRGLRVLMAGKNRISTISNLTALRKLDVLDLHSNEIRLIEGLEGLTDLRVLNLAGNRISLVQNLSSLQALTELNLRRNNIERVAELDKLPALQRIFLSHNLLASFQDVQCLFSVKLLIELSLDGNPLSESDSTTYRNRIVGGMEALRHLDLKRITDAERTQALQWLGASKDEADGTSSQANSNSSSSSSSSSSKLKDSQGLLPAANGDGAWVAGENGSTGPPNPNGTGGEVANDDESASAAVKGSGSGGGGGGETQQSGLAALARAGRISPNHSLFDLELIGPNEKALIVVGDAWEWVQAKRLLVNVTEASLFHMKKDVVVGRFSPNVSWLPALKCLRLVNNDLESLKDVGSLLESLGRSASTLEHLILKDSPICQSPGLLRHYVCSILPNLKSLNETDITVLERADSSRLLAPVMRIHDLASTQNILPAQPPPHLHHHQQQQSQQPQLQPTGVDVDGEQDQQQPPMLPPPQQTGRSGSNAGLRGKLVGASASGIASASTAVVKRPGASMGSRSASVPGCEQAISDLIADMSASAVNSLKMSAQFDEALHKAAQKIIVETVRQLYKI